jgi:hypothetical protein
MDGPIENEYAYCPGCGHLILVAPIIIGGSEEGDLLFDMVAQ